jgi:hypothetical protein
MLMRGWRISIWKSFVDEERSIRHAVVDERGV